MSEHNQSLYDHYEGVISERNRRIAELEAYNASRTDELAAAARRIAELEQQRDELLAAAENLIKVKGRHHTEQAYKALEVAIAKVKP